MCGRGGVSVGVLHVVEFSLDLCLNVVLNVWKSNILFKDTLCHMLILYEILVW